MNKSRKLLATIFLLALTGSVLVAQQPTAEVSATPPPQNQSLSAAAPSSPGQQNIGQSQAMDKMATTVTRAAEMCEMMMKKEMEGAPFKKAAGLALGLLFLTALVLFVILEVQWIIYWSRLLKTQKRGDRL